MPTTQENLPTMNNFRPKILAFAKPTPSAYKSSVAAISLCMLFFACAVFFTSPAQAEEQPKEEVVTLPQKEKQLPENLSWQTNHSDPIFASKEAKRGGRFRDFILSFPLTLRLVGPDSNGSFAGYMRANDMALIDVHPNTKKPIPSLATHWAFAEDGKTVFFKLDPDARWSDGVPVTADDFLFCIEFMRSKEIVAPFYNNYYSQQIVDVTKYDSHLISVTFVNPLPPEELILKVALGPKPAHFHKLTNSWVRDYNWKIAPVTGPYKIDKIRKGKYIEFKRQQDWWANDKKYFQYRFNPEYLRVKVIRDQNVAYQYFSKGLLDTFDLVLPQLWHKKAQGKAYDKGYIHKIKFYNEKPQPPYGLYLNEGDPILADQNVRYAIAHATNIEKVIKTVLRNDYERLERANDGYGDYTNNEVKARTFDLAQAEYYLDQAGWEKRDATGVRTKNGERLSLRVTYMSPAHTPRLVVLKEEALKAGIEFKLQMLDGSAGFKQITEKKHQIAWMGWSAGGISPRFWQGWHSDNANKAGTNNITNTANPEIDRLIDTYRAEFDRDTRISLAHKIQSLIHEQGSYVPTYKVPYTRGAHWRWIKLPAFYGNRSSASLYDVMGDGLLWIDEALKEETLHARFVGDEFKPVNIVDETWR